MSPVNRRASRLSAGKARSPRIRREVVDEPGHDGTIRLGRDAVQRAGVCVGRKPLSRKGRAPLRRDLSRRRQGRNGSRMLVRAVPRVIACPAPHLSREPPNGGLGDGWFSGAVGGNVTLATALLTADNRAPSRHAVLCRPRLSLELGRDARKTTAAELPFRRPTVRFSGSAQRRPLQPAVRPCASHPVILVSPCSPRSSPPRGHRCGSGLLTLCLACTPLDQ